MLRVLPPKSACVAFLLPLLLSACFITGVFKDKPVSERIQDAQIILTLAQKSIQEDVVGGFIAPSEARARYEKVKAIHADLSDVRKVFLDGKVDLAELQMSAIERSMSSLHAYIRKKANEDN